MIRATQPDDTPTLLQLTTETKFFKPLEIQALREVLDDYHASNRELGHRCVTFESQDQIRGFAYYAPAAMTENTWYLYWIAVSKELHGQGIGSQLLRHLEADIREQMGRLLLIETSSTPRYEPTRQFYVRHGYEQEAVLRDFYAVGDGMVIYRKEFV